MTEKEILEIKKDAADPQTKGGLVRAAVRFLGAEERIAHTNGDDIPLGMEASVGGIVSEVEASAVSNETDSRPQKRYRNS
jgi:hypothetical protein